ncbi:MAG: ABC transporter ATP-binding protein [Aestuariivirga sp.]
MISPTPKLPVLSVDRLGIDARTPEGLKPVLRDVSFTLAPSETLCIAGESGSGKSLTALAIMRLLSSSLKQCSGQIKLQGRELTTLSDIEMRKLRGGEIAMIFQDPMSSLNPVMTIGTQMTEAIREHSGSSNAEQRAREMLDAVHIGESGRRLGQYPHELSGGMRQRVMIGMALSCRPKVLIADEPTTALDVTVQAQILKLMKELKSEFSTSIVLITHDMGVVAEMADRVALLHHGQLVEQGNVSDIFERPQQDYTKRLLTAVAHLGAYRGTDSPPRVTASLPATTPSTVLVVKDLSVAYGVASGPPWRRQPPKPVVKNVSFELKAGQTLGLVGESGSGKSTTGKALLGLVPSHGDIIINGTNTAGLSRSAMKPLRRQAQMIFQDPYASLDSRMAVGEAIAEPLAIHNIGTKAERRDKVMALLERVRLLPEHATRYPHEFSGGQRQRICIARALALEPNIIVADESVSALDVSVRSQVLDLMQELQEQMNIAYIFISHDMAVIERMSHHVAVMTAGEIVEYGTRRKVFESPSHPYTRSLMDAVPRSYRTRYDD